MGEGDAMLEDKMLHILSRFHTDSTSHIHIELLVKKCTELTAGVFAFLGK